MTTANAASPLGGVRAFIAKRMRHSLAETAQISYFSHADVDAVLAARAAWKSHGVAAGFEDFVIAALGKLVGKHPDFNAHYENGQLTRFTDCHVSVAMASPSGLVTPVVRNAGAALLPEIVRQRRALHDRAARGALAIEDMKGGTITISNLGVSRVQHFTPILNPPQVAIVGLGRIDEVAAFTGNLVVKRHRLALSLTTDHQIVDGAPCGAFLTDLCQELEQTSVDG